MVCTACYVEEREHRQLVCFDGNRNLGKIKETTV